MAEHKFDFNNRVVEGHYAKYEGLSSIPGTDTDLSTIFSSSMYTNILTINNVGAMNWRWNSSGTNRPSQQFKLKTDVIIPHEERIGKIKMTWRGKARSYCKWTGFGGSPSGNEKNGEYVDPLFEIEEGETHDCPVVCRCVLCICVFCPSTPHKVKIYAFNYTTNSYVYKGYVTTSWATKTYWLDADDYVKSDGTITILTQMVKGSQTLMCNIGYAIANECYTDYVSVETWYRKPNTIGTDEKHWGIKNGS